MSWFDNNGSGQGGFGSKLMIPSVREERITFSSNSSKFDMLPKFSQCPFSNILKSKIQFNFNMNIANFCNKIDNKIDTFFYILQSGLNGNKKQNFHYI